MSWDNALFASLTLSVTGPHVPRGRERRRWWRLRWRWVRRWRWWWRRLRNCQQELLRERGPSGISLLADSDRPAVEWDISHVIAQVVVEVEAVVKLAHTGVVVEDSVRAAVIVE